MRARIHRGAHEIGGSCVELESQGRRLLLDLGRPLDAARDDVVPLPQVEGLRHPDPALLGIVLSHPHQDHWGQIPEVTTDVPVFSGAITAKILRQASFFGAGAYAVAPQAELSDRQSLQIGPFRVRPFLADHSCVDAYSLLVEADGQRLFYTGDLRAHGRHGGRFADLLAHPPPAVDTLLLEGTHVRSDGTDWPQGPSEAHVLEQLVATFEERKGLILAAFSAQNIDRLCSVHQACLRSGRTLIVDLYAATMALVSGEPDAPVPGSPGYRIWVPQNQRVRIKRAQEFERVKQLGEARVFPNQLRGMAEDSVLLFRGGLAKPLGRAVDLDDATLVWSMWSGYLKGDHGAATRQLISEHRWQVRHHHASGHASVADLQALVAAMAPKTVVPIHTEGADRYSDLFAGVSVHADGQWWEIGQ